MYTFTLYRLSDRMVIEQAMSEPTNMKVSYKEKVTLIESAMMPKQTKWTLPSHSHMGS